ncbi:MAG TPA: sulfur carrier protein ThiS adenylyltransferase ThiF [Acidobacteriota bacterium]|nr:sulfur carrier protein ThiS adenylyltransferase ThiF [Acidobacteriota bacterium]
MAYEVAYKKSVQRDLKKLSKPEMKIVAVVGPSGSGKTTLLARLIPELRSRGLKVGVIKHTHKDVSLDTEGKDTWTFTEVGAGTVALITPSRAAVFLRTAPDVEDLARRFFADADIVLVEGGKAIGGLKKIDLVHEGVERIVISPDELLAVVSDSPAAGDTPVLRTSQTKELADLLVAMPLPPSGAAADGLFSKRDPRVLAALRKGTVGIAGAGGLGSNVAVSLARAGVGRLIVADRDAIEPSNLNRQQYFVSQIGRRKVDALKENLEAINPFSEYVVHDVEVTAANVVPLFGDADIMVEAFDKAETKRMLIETWLSQRPGRPVVAASGLAGYGGNRKLHSRRMGDLYVCGDEESQCPEGVSPMAPRVAIVANLQANLVVALLVRKRGRKAKHV